MSSLTKRLRDVHLEEAEQEAQIESSSSSFEGLESPMDNFARDPDYKDEEATFPSVSDENVVNTGFVSFASVLTYSIEGVRAHWSQERKGFKVGEIDGIKLSEARTDGHLFLPSEKTSKVTIEVKPTMRDKAPRVRMQETAQMAAWIHVERDIPKGKQIEQKRFRRLMLSQDRHEIYIIIGDYDLDYMDYLTNLDHNTTCQSFLTMNEFGPWGISDAGQVEEIASIILAVTLQLGNSEPLIQQFHGTD
ncbi:hypothetical protein PHISCL_06259 [Aspergillus sclerotialis]|uniref:Uncharacterized protein n=1 Tax=Aspergillus sclerotialis TaxID=2070753 RepID=A0A3A2ZE12_9EURO|nr:hypothetical protein PHISCL_06259 [Aspergillus sclerotialis]